MDLDRVSCSRLYLAHEHRPLMDPPTRSQVVPAATISIDNYGLHLIKTFAGNCLPAAPSDNRIGSGLQRKAADRSNWSGKNRLSA